MVPIGKSKNGGSGSTIPIRAARRLRRSPGCRPSPKDADRRERRYPTLVCGEATENEIHHRMTIAYQVLPQKLAPRVAHRPVVDAQTSFAMDMPDHVIVAQNVVRKRRHQRADIATAIRNEPDQHSPAVVTASGLLDYRAPCARRRS